MTRIKRDSIAYVVIAGFCVLALSWAIPTYSPPYPGYGASPAMVPMVAVGLMLFMAVLSLVRIFVAKKANKPVAAKESQFPEDLKSDDGFTQVGRVNLKHLAYTMVPCVLLVVAIEYLGYVVSSFAFLMLFQYAIGCRKWVQATIVAVVMTLVLYVVMRYGFGVPVPGPELFE